MDTNGHWDLFITGVFRTESRANKILQKTLTTELESTTLLDHPCQVQSSSGVRTTRRSGSAPFATALPALDRLNRVICTSILKCHFAGGAWADDISSMSGATPLLC